MTRPSPVLVLGAAALPGPFLLKRLTSEGHAWAALSRRSGPGGTEGRWFQGDLEKPGDLRLPAAEAVISLAPIWRLPSALPALKAAGARRLVALSSTSAVTKAASPDSAERDIAAALRNGEARTLAFCRDAGIACLMLRPTLIYAEGLDGNVTRLARLIRRFGVLPLYGEGEGRRQPVHAEDVAEAALAALDAVDVFGDVLDLPGGETLTYRSMAERVFEGLGRRPRIVSLPPPLWRVGFALASPWLPGAGAAMGARMAEDLVFDAEPARRRLNWSGRPFRPDFRGVAL